MIKKQCLGCGVPLQSVEPDRPGYLPPGKADALICQRCYRLRHYGQFKKTGDDGETTERAIRAALHKSDLILMVVDVFDPEGSLPFRWTDLLKLPVLLVVNKADLLPARTPWVEMINWFQGFWAQRLPEVELQGVKVISNRLKGPDLNHNLNILKQELNGKKVTILGAANVGKTSLIASLLASENEKQAGIPTVSRYPGTTQGTTSWVLHAYNLKIYDTPGLLPGGRMGDLFSPQTAGRLLPEKKLQVKLWNLPPDGAVLGGGVVGVWNLSPAESTLVFFTGENTTLHRSRGPKAEALLREEPDWLRIYPRNERPAQFREEIYTVPAGADLYISGFGWVAVKRETARLKVVTPVGVEVGTRPSLIGRREG